MAGGRAAGPGGVRRKWLKQFPLGVVYTIDDDSIVFIGIMHGAQDLARWQEGRGDKGAS
jgi:hypothetical protein